MQKAPEEPKLPKTKQEKDKGGRLIVILVPSRFYFTLDDFLSPQPDLIICHLKRQTNGC